MKKRFVSLVAVSSERQAEKISLEDQSINIQKEVDRWSGEIVERLEIPGHTRSYTSLHEAEVDIPAYKRLHELIVSKSFDVLIFFNYSRLARDIGVGGNIISLCQKHKITVYQSSSPPSSLEFRKDAMGLFMSAWGLVGSHNERDEIVRRNEMGMKERIKRGDFPKFPPWGWLHRWETNDGKPVMIAEIDPEAKSTLDRIISMYLSGMGRHTICDIFNQENVQTRAGKGIWMPGMIENLLSRIWLYAGFVEINKHSADREYVRAPMRWPALISQETAAKVEAERKSRLRSGRAVNSPHRYSRIVYCLSCGKPMSAAHKRYYRGSKMRIHSVYRCLLPTHTKGIRKQIPARAIDEVMTELLSDADSYNKLVAKESAGNPKKIGDTIRAAIETANSELTKLNDGVSRINGLYAIEQRIDKTEYDRLTGEINKRIMDAQGRLTTLQSSLIVVQRDESRTDRQKEFIERGLLYVTSPDVALSNSWLKKHIRIWIHDGSVKDIEVGI